MEPIDMTTREPWHLRFMTFMGMRSSLDSKSHWGELTTCTYIRSFFLAVIAMIAFTGGVLVGAYLLAKSIVLLGIVMYTLSTFDIFRAAALLIEMYQADYGTPALVLHALATVIPVLTLIIAGVFAVGIAVMYLLHILGEAQHKVAGVIHTPSAITRLNKAIAESTTVKLADSWLHKYCVPVRTSADPTRAERVAAERKMYEEWQAQRDAADQNPDAVDE